MRFILYDPEGIIDYRFCSWLISRIKMEYANVVNTAKYAAMNEYLDTLDFMARHKGQTSDTIMRLGVNSLITKEFEGRFVIQINDTLMFDTKENIKLSSMCKLINYGTMSVKGYPILIELFNHFADNIDMLVRYYYTYVDRG